MKNILIISYSPLHRDPRIIRQIETFKDSYNIETIGYTDANIENVKYFEVKYSVCNSIIEKLKKFADIAILHKHDKVIEKTYSLQSLLFNDYKTPDVIIGNDWTGLYTAVYLKEHFNWNCKIYFDSHEYFPKYKESLMYKIRLEPLILHTLKKCKNDFDVMSTVCPTLAKMYECFYNKPAETVKIVTNAPAYLEELSPKSVSEGKIKLIHHGVASRERNLELMIDLMEFLPSEKYELDFMLVSLDRKYYNYLVNRAKKFNNIHFLEPVEFSEIPKVINNYDIGLFILNNKHMNYKYALPNKFFEFVQARLAIAVGDSPEMRTYLEKYQLGVAAKTNTAKDMANEILKLTPEKIMDYKNNSHIYAKELSYEKNKIVLTDIIESLLS